MIREDKSKLKSKTKSKILVLGFVLLTLFGVFGGGDKASAVEPPPSSTDGTCTVSVKTYNILGRESETFTESFPSTTTDCRQADGFENKSQRIKDFCEGKWRATEYGPPITSSGKDEACKSSFKTADGRVAGALHSSEDKSEFANMVGEAACLGFTPGSFSMTGCALKFLFYVIYQPVAVILVLMAKFFDYLIYMTTDGALLQANFVGSAWGVVRDISNIFFILILLYAAFELILDLGHGGAKKIIANVIIMALLINFSMFFTKVVIDSSNILALVFYSKLEVKTNVGGKPQEHDPITKERNISGAMAEAFDLTQLMDKPTFEAAKNLRANANVTLKEGSAPTGMMIVVLLVAIAIMVFAGYAFLVAGLSFLGRLIELFVLIIFSPFAFMSFAVPQLKGAEYIGWDKWSGRLISVSFMAPIFMFFMYFIFLLMREGLKNELIAPNANADIIERLLFTVIPAVFILILLLKAVEFAKKGSGAFGEAVMKGAKIAGGLALGAATGGVALAGTGVIGSMAAKAASNDETKRRALGLEGTASQQAWAKRKLALSSSLAAKSFDFRQTGLGKFAEKSTGMSFDKGLGSFGLDTKSFKGGRAEQIEHKAEEEQKKAKKYELSGEAAVEQEHKAEKFQEELLHELEGRTFANDKAKAEFVKNFRKDYETTHGSVASVSEINKDRRIAYAASLDKKAAEEAGHAVKTFFKEWGKGMGKMAYSSPVGLGTTAAIGAATGGVGAVITIAGGGFLYALKQTLSVKATNAEVRAEVREGESKDKKLLKLIKEAGKGDSHEKDHKPAAAAPKPPAPATGGAAPAADHDADH